MSDVLMSFERKCFFTEVLFHGSAFIFTRLSILWCEMQCSMVIACVNDYRCVEVTWGTGSLYVKVIADVLWICCDGFSGGFCFFIVTFSTASCID